MTTYEAVRHADHEWQQQMRAIDDARRALVDATARWTSLTASPRG